jgi:hypothetical protein
MHAVNASQLWIHVTLKRPELRCACAQVTGTTTGIAAVGSQSNALNEQCCVVDDTNNNTDITFPDVSSMQPNSPNGSGHATTAHHLGKLKGH